MLKLADDTKIKVRLECLKIVWLTASRVSIDEDARVKAAEKLYKYVTEDNAIAPSEATG